MSVTVIRISESLSDRLQGRLLGREHFAQACALLASEIPGGLVVLDFDGVKHVTGSWINSMLVPLFLWAANKENDLFPVLTNVRPEWLDELRLVAEWNHQCYLVSNHGGIPPKRACLVGRLDPAQRSSLNTVLKTGETTGARLERQNPEEDIRATAWNNRLKDLYNKRLLRRERHGRERIYSAVVKEISENG